MSWFSRGCCKDPDPPLDCHVCDANFGDGWVMDLGAGGWTSVECDNCEGIAGEFDLAIEPAAYCLWTFQQLEWCTDNSEWAYPPWNHWDLTVSLSIPHPADPWRYEATVQLEYDIPPWYSWARFQSATSTSEDCLDLLDGAGKLELTKYWEYHWPQEHPLLGDSCAGALPSTIWAWLA